MAKARARTAARKVKDKWKTKQWYQLLAPAMFNKTVIAETLADDPNKLLHRVSSTTLQDLTGDFKLMHVKLEFQVTEVTGTQGSSVFVGHTLTSDYVRRLIRRNHSKISCVFDVTTKDGAGIRVKPFAVTDRRSQSSQQTAIRNAIGKTLVAEAADKTMAAFVQEMLNGTLANKVYRVCKPIYPLRKIEINKSEVFQQPTVQMDEPVAAPAAAPEAPVAPDAAAEEPESEVPVEEEEEPAAATTEA
ncbi:MAG TPA: 30S ribosomal protein S3ae [Candidatus Thermoplasmatota archaeon]|nr:30S ribosomal protein S3ae [Candidatus Thermoplasmatota archaeon]